MVRKYIYIVIISLLIASCAKNTSLELNFPSGFCQVEFDAKGGYAELVLETNSNNWTIEYDCDWLEAKVVPEASKIEFNAQGNTSADPRQTTISILSHNEEIISFDVMQDGLKTPNLSLSGNANCYLIENRRGEFCFDATVVGNGVSGLSSGFHVKSVIIEPESAGLVWQDQYFEGKGLISEVHYEKSLGMVFFTVSENFRSGNALIAVYDKKGEIMWSWHIWLVDGAISEYVTQSGYTLMGMNLGAKNNSAGDIGSYGLLYQWGRKDPFVGSPSLTGTITTTGASLYGIEGVPVIIDHSSRLNISDNTIEYSIKNPTICLSNGGQVFASGDWLNSENSSDNLWGDTKTIYDPCPAGWRVPSEDTFKYLSTTGGYTWADGDDRVSTFRVEDVNGDGVLDINDYYYGWNFLMSGSQYLYFPAAARYDGTYAMLMGSVSGIWGSYWTNAPFSSTSGVKGLASAFGFQIKTLTGSKMITLSPLAGGSRADAYSVRCVKE